MRVNVESDKDNRFEHQLFEEEDNWKKSKTERKLEKKKSKQNFRQLIRQGIYDLDDFDEEI
jgi:hypothetical protein